MNPLATFTYIDVYFFFARLAPSRGDENCVSRLNSPSLSLPLFFPPSLCLFSFLLQLRAATAQGNDDMGARGQSCLPTLPFTVSVHSKMFHFICRIPVRINVFHFRCRTYQLIMSIEQPGCISYVGYWRVIVPKRQQPRQTVTD